MRRRSEAAPEVLRGTSEVPEVLGRAAAYSTVTLFAKLRG